MLLWAERFDVSFPTSFVDLRRRMSGRPAVKAAMEQEGLLEAKERMRHIREDAEPQLTT
jgi:hypothetical protein